MNSVLMASRIALLTLMTGMFAVIWAGDDSDKLAEHDRPARVWHVRHPSSGRNQRQDASVQISSVGTTRENGAKVPLPTDIPAGEYLVVNSRGETRTRVIESTDRAPRPNVPGTRDHFTVEVGTVKWHYIRVDAKQVQPAAMD